MLIEEPHTKHLMLDAGHLFLDAGDWIFDTE
jgi:hypothetical protein